jgi:isopenicillin N synthase-like dioxygenase
MGEKLESLAAKMLLDAESLFRSDTPQTSYMYFGYTKNHVRDSSAVRVLTGRYASALPLPASIQKEVVRLSSTMDNLMRDLVRATCDQVFAKTFDEFVTDCKLPLLYSKEQSSRCGMLDIVSYLPKFTDTVSAHVDPGLFALSLKSTSPGLEMLDVPTKTWIPIEPEQSILWCGSTASEKSNGVILGGQHRVAVPLDQAVPRLTLWYEICALDQIPTHMLGLRTFIPEEKLGSVETNSETITVMIKSLTGKVSPLKVPKYGTVYDLKLQYQDKEGIPPSKCRLIFLTQIDPAESEGEAKAEPLKYIARLMDDIRLAEYGIGDGSIVHSVLSLRV